MDRSAIIAAGLGGLVVGFACGSAWATWRRSWRDVGEAKGKLTNMRRVAWGRTWPWSGWLAVVLVAALLAFGFAARK